MGMPQRGITDLALSDGQNGFKEPSIGRPWNEGMFNLKKDVEVTTNKSLHWVAVAALLCATASGIPTKAAGKNDG
jgi:hypothetical protein